MTMSDDITRCPSCGRRNRVPATASGTPRCGSCHEPLPWITSAGDATFAEVVEQSAQPVLVDFWAPWCGPCRMVSPALEQLAGEKPGQLKLVKINVDESPRLQQRFGIQSIPTLMVFRDGILVFSQPGALPAAALEQLIQAVRGLDMDEVRAELAGRQAEGALR